MPVILDTQTSASVVHDFDADGNTLILTEGGVMISTGLNDVIRSEDSRGTALLNGEVVISTGTGLRRLGDFGVVVLGETGSVTSVRTAVVFGEGTTNMSLDNAGSITGEWGVVSYAADLDLQNSGSSVGYSSDDSCYTVAGLHLIDQTDDDRASVNQIEKSGEISGRSYAIYAGEYSGYCNHYASQTHIVNSGTLQGGQIGSVFLGLENVIDLSALVAGGVRSGLVRRLHRHGPQRAGL